MCQVDTGAFVSLLAREKMPTTLATLKKLPSIYVHVLPIELLLRKSDSRVRVRG